MISVDKAGETAMRIWGYPDWTNPNFPRRPRSLAGNGTGSVTLVGTASAINAALNKSTYHTTSTNQQVGNVDDTLQVSVTDQAGNTSSKSVNIDVTCFMPGTLIRTPAGDVAVELLEIGDQVLTVDGRSVPVRWIGRQTVSTIFANKDRVLPIRIRAGALAYHPAQKPGRTRWLPSMLAWGNPEARPSRRPSCARQPRT
jgi:Hint domain